MGRSAAPLYLELIRTAPGTTLTRDQLKQERLRELRATIDALRRDSGPPDPLLTWLLDTSPGERSRAGSDPHPAGSGNKSD